MCVLSHHQLIMAILRWEKQVNSPHQHLREVERIFRLALIRRKLYSYLETVCTKRESSEYIRAFVCWLWLFCFAGFYSKLVSRTLKKYKTELSLLDSHFLVLNKHRLMWRVTAWKWISINSIYHKHCFQYTSSVYMDTQEWEKCLHVVIA